MEINELNYEGYALDYAEGTLSGEALVAMEMFLQQHPELKEEILAICATTLPEAETVVFEDKSLLLKQSSPVRLLKISFAISTAACLLLALGFVWLLSKQDSYGELAHKGFTLNIHTNVTVVDGTKASESIDLPIDYTNQIASNNSEEKVQKPVIQIPVKKEESLNDIQLANTDKTENNFEKESIESLEELESKDLIVEETEPSKDDILKIEAPLVAQSTENIAEIKGELEDKDLVVEVIVAENESAVSLKSYPVEYVNSDSKKTKSNKSARRRAIKGSLWGVFQSSFIPEGIASN